MNIVQDTQTAIQTALVDNDMVAAMIFIASAAAGQILHSVKKWLEGEHWACSNVKRTIAAMIGNLSGMIIFIQTGVLAPLMSLPNGTFSIILFGFMNGFAADSGLNKGTRKVLSDDERAAKRAQGG